MDNKVNTKDISDSIIQTLKDSGIDYSSLVLPLNKYDEIYLKEIAPMLFMENKSKEKPRIISKKQKFVYCN